MRILAVIVIGLGVAVARPAAVAADESIPAAPVADPAPSADTGPPDHARPGGRHGPNWPPAEPPPWRRGSPPPSEALADPTPMDPPPAADPGAGDPASGSHPSDPTAPGDTAPADEPPPSEPEPAPAEPEPAPDPGAAGSTAPTDPVASSAPAAEEPPAEAVSEPTSEATEPDVEPRASREETPRRIGPVDEAVETEAHAQAQAQAHAWPTATSSSTAPRARANDSTPRAVQAMSPTGRPIVAVPLFSELPCASEPGDTKPDDASTGEADSLPVAVSASVGAAVVIPRVTTTVSVAMDFARLSGGWAGPMVFNFWLRRQLRERRMSQRQLASLSGVDHSTISRLLSDRRTPSLETAAKLVHALRHEWTQEQVATYFDLLPERTLFPTQRVESALRGDPDLSEADVRRLMDAYLVARSRRRADERAQEAATDGAAEPSGQEAPFDGSGIGGPPVRRR